MDKRKEQLFGKTYKFQTGCGILYVTVNRDDNKIVEVFTHLGKGGGCMSQSESAAKLCSLGLKFGVPIEEIIKQLKGIRCFSAIKCESANCLSCPDAVGRALLQDIGQIPVVEKEPHLTLHNHETEISASF